MEINQAIRLTEDLLAQYDVCGYTVTSMKLRRAIGRCSARRKEIQLSSILIPVCTDEGAIDTIKHEIAHALTPGDGHGAKWRAKAIELGANPTRTAEDSKLDTQKRMALMDKYKYTLTCPVCGYKSGLSRMVHKNIGRSCGVCSPGRYDEKFRLIIKQNY